ncbi:hypothetical protein Amet_3525 [Alkaliphilus metalliredigens QYMF]|uniref:Uncharacterized protein n=1 Tax=Alkaliphilus metalliredigens (strain QYMF) TaxID=293826 RepID=A6TTY4_ALKMQ|nr:hypothetical protein Amet_3525 [Alkaliphilus metalliredigens QYMF]
MTSTIKRSNFLILWASFSLVPELTTMMNMSNKKYLDLFTKQEQIEAEKRD